MASVQIQLDGDALRDATMQAISGVLSPEVKKAMIDSAILTILKPSTSSWDQGRSPIEQAFERAVNAVAQEEAQRMVSEDEALRERLQKLLRDAADRILSIGVEKLVGRMADSFVDSLRR